MGDSIEKLVGEPKTNITETKSKAALELLVQSILNAS